MKYNVNLDNFFEKYEKIGGSTDINNVYKIPSMNSYDVIDGGLNISFKGSWLDKKIDNYSGRKKEKQWYNQYDYINTIEKKLNIYLKNGNKKIINELQGKIGYDKPELHVLIDNLCWTPKQIQDRILEIHNNPELEQNYHTKCSKKQLLQKQYKKKALKLEENVIKQESKAERIIAEKQKT